MIIDSRKQAIVVYSCSISGVHANFLALFKSGWNTEEDLKKDNENRFGKERNTEAKAWKTIGLLVRASQQ